MAASEQRQLDGFIAKFTPEISDLARDLLKGLRKRLPGAVEMVYDNYYALVIGFGPNERPSEAVFSLVIYPQHVSLCFLRGALELKDPKGLLKGGGKRVRHIRLANAEALEEAPVRDLISEAVAVTLFRLNPAGAGTLIIRSVCAKQRSRRPS